jgi:N-acetylglutamate synthase-like GNAT family acetyltransferase
MFTYRKAEIQDIPAIEDLMDLSISKVLGKLTDKRELEASYESMGLDTKLIEDNSYFLIFEADILIGSGGYSIRKTLFGGNHTPNRSDDLLIPGKEPSKIRAMYTHPDWIRKGVGSTILELSENESKKLGFSKAELMATISGILLYQDRGYEVDKEIEYESRAGNKVKMYRMFKNL